MIPIGQAIGKSIVCPCGFCNGSPARVTHSRVRTMANAEAQRSPVASAYVIAECRVGKKLWPNQTPVELSPESPPPPKVVAETPLHVIEQMQRSVVISPEARDGGRTKRKA